MFTRNGPWGELLTQNIKLQRPDEYFAQEVANPHPETWNFATRTPEQIKALLIANGLTKEQTEAQLTSGHLTTNGNNYLLTPDENFLLLLKPETRQKLYGGLYGLNLETYIDFPFIFPQDAIETVYADSQLNSEDVALLKQLIYQVTGAFRLSDNCSCAKFPPPNAWSV